MSIASVMKRAREQLGQDVFPAVPKSAGKRGPVLVVPANTSVLHIAVDLPKETNLGNGEQWQLTELGGPASVAPAQLMPAISADGTVGNSHGMVAADIPPRSTAASGSRRSSFEPSRTEPAKAFRFSDLNSDSLKLFDGDKAVLVYNHGVITNELACPRATCAAAGLATSIRFGASTAKADRRFPQGPLPSSRHLLGVAARRHRRQKIRPVGVQGHHARFVRWLAASRGRWPRCWAWKTAGSSARRRS